MLKRARPAADKDDDDQDDSHDESDDGDADDPPAAPSSSEASGERGGQRGGRGGQRGRGGRGGRALCRYFARGNCRHGARCQYSHDRANAVPPAAAAGARPSVLATVRACACAPDLHGLTTGVACSCWRRTLARMRRRRCCSAFGTWWRTASLAMTQAPVLLLRPALYRRRRRTYVHEGGARGPCISGGRGCPTCACPQTSAWAWR
jgi:hypothetical protein